MEEQSQPSYSTAEVPQGVPKPEEVRKSDEPASESAEVAEEQKGQSTEDGYITGFKFALVLCSVTMVGFLFLLDVSIVSTVCPYLSF
jgi:F0F1-type ATP synthase assembly protein I